MGTPRGPLDSPPQVGDLILAMWLQVCIRHAWENFGDFRKGLHESHWVPRVSSLPTQERDRTGSGQCPGMGVPCPLLSALPLLIWGLSSSSTNCY